MHACICMHMYAYAGGLSSSCRIQWCTGPDPMGRADWAGPDVLGHWPGRKTWGIMGPGAMGICMHMVGCGWDCIGHGEGCIIALYSQCLLKRTDYVWKGQGIHGPGWVPGHHFLHQWNRHDLRWRPPLGRWGRGFCFCGRAKTTGSNFGRRLLLT